MCGLNGIFGNIAHQDKKVSQDLLVVSAMRGPHSTGIGYARKNFTPGYIKLDAAPFTFMQDDDVKAVFENKWHSLDLLMGHNRYATRGNITSENAHPFLHGDILLTHNGHITNGPSLFRDVKNFEVDSEYIAYAFSKHEAKDVVKEISGAFCLAWWDEGQENFHIVRNDERPIWIAKNQNRDTWYYASERPMLEFVLGRNNISYAEPFTLEPGELLTWDRTAKSAIHREKIGLKRFVTSYSHMYGGWDKEDKNETRPRMTHQNGQWKPVGQSNSAVTTPSTPTTTTPANSTATKVISLEDFKKIKKAKSASDSWKYEYGREWLKAHGIEINTEGQEHYIFALMSIFAPYTNTTFNQGPDKEHGIYRGTLADPKSYSTDKVRVAIHGVRRSEVMNKESGRIVSQLVKGKLMYCHFDDVTNTFILHLSKWEATADSRGCIRLHEGMLKPNYTTTLKVEDTPPSDDEIAEVTIVTQGDGTEVATVEEKDDGPAPARILTPEWPFGPLGFQIAPDSFKRLTKDGCSYCSCDLLPVHSRLICWNNEKEPFCRECAAIWNIETGEVLRSKVALTEKDFEGIRKLRASKIQAILGDDE